MLPRICCSSTLPEPEDSVSCVVVRIWENAPIMASMEKEDAVIWIGYSLSAVSSIRVM